MKGVLKSREGFVPPSATKLVVRDDLTDGATCDKAGVPEDERSNLLDVQHISTAP